MALRRFERRWLARILVTILPSGPDAELPGLEGVPVEAFLDRVTSRAPAETVGALRAAAWLVTWAPLLWRLRMRPFARLGRDDREALLESMAGSRIYLLRQVPEMLKTLACLAWAGLPEVQRALGMPAPDPDPPAWRAEAAAGAETS